MNCPSGHPNGDGMTFCTQCGARIASNPAPINSQEFSQPGISANPFDAVAPVWPNQGIQFQPEPQLQNNSTKKIAIISVVATLLVVLIIVGVVILRPLQSNSVAIPEESEPTTKMVTVSLTVMNDLDGCDLPFGYFDIPGAQFELRADGEVVAFGSYPSTGLDLTYGCKFMSSVFNVPDDAEIYSVSLASGKRGTIYNTRAELSGNSWVFDLTLGES